MGMMLVVERYIVISFGELVLALASSNHPANTIPYSKVEATDKLTLQ
jgi:hypothetical protein